ncbi:alginate biosynthesis transcriptional regulatory protein AlgB [Arenimonas soli]|uniref:Alginate biosynthesis transcriptional regulatory protein AlgB n=1 Tax=Arenimonas soli TaxID=2269504 RepID=A0ABQ1HN50_9GAMM|nr:sigma-54 dependent transcriptional regulator [Arenimonas soli]GGA83738.1 alginate biosynthesis transcriptional regulatory protein AlgB [Arenimonas soli]
MSNLPAAPQGRILAIDDDPGLLQNFALCLEDAGYRVNTATRLQEGMKLAASQPFHVCLLDRDIAGDSGLDALPRLRELAPGLRVIMVTAHSHVEDAVRAIAEGAADYLVKPCSPAQLRIAVARQLDTLDLLSRLETLERQQPRQASTLQSNSPAMSEVLAVARQVARTDANVLLLGESGTGKGVLANAIHGWSPRASRPLATVNCPSLSAELLESELFGHAKGSFTGATQSTQGRASHADGGTLFLDEVGDFPLALQPKLLRFVQDKEYERIGEPDTRRADVRIISATNRDLEAMVRDNSFRLDLLYRLNVISLVLPPLRDRREDLAALANGFVRRYANSYHLPARHLSEQALLRMQAYAWPGNVRELQNVIERAVILCTGEQIGPEHLALGGEPAPAGAGSGVGVGAPVSLETLERAHIEAVMAHAETLEAAARTLGIDGSTLYRKRKAYGL